MKEENPTLKNLLNEALIDFNEDSIHKFRLEIKKIRATVQLIHRQDKSFNDKRAYQLIRPIYKDLGSVRAIHVLLEKFNDSHRILKASVREKILEILDKALIEQQYFVLIGFDNSVFKSMKKVKRQVKKALKNVSHKGFKKYFKVRTNKLITSFESLIFSEKQLHQLRMLIKEIKFNMSFEPKVAEKRLKKKGMDLSTLDNLQKWLGDWLDNMLLKQKLVEWGSTLSLQKGEKAALTLFQSHIDDANEAIMNQVKAVLKFF